MLVQLAGQWGRAVIHVCDRGYAGALWVGLLLAFHLRFIVRGPHGYRLLDAEGISRLTWHLTVIARRGGMNARCGTVGGANW